MSNSAEDEAPDPENLDYENLDEDIREVIEEPDGETEEFSVKVGHDGKQHIIRVPSEVSDTLNLEQGDEVKFLLAVNPKNPDENKLKIEYPKFQ